MKSSLTKSLGYHTSNDFIVDAGPLIAQYKKGATADELLSAEIMKTPEDIKRTRTFPNVDGIKFLTHARHNSPDWINTIPDPSPT